MRTVSPARATGSSRASSTEGRHRRFRIPWEIVSTGETWSYDVAGESPAITEIQGGSYLMMETHYSYMTSFQLRRQDSDTINQQRLGLASPSATLAPPPSAHCAGMPEVDARPGVSVEVDGRRPRCLQPGRRSVAECGRPSAPHSLAAGCHGQSLGPLRGLRNGKVERYGTYRRAACHN